MSELVRYDAMCRAIEAAVEVDEVKDIRDKALAIEHYSRQAKNFDNERNACIIRLRAERKAGELLREMKAAGKLAKGGSPYHSINRTGYVAEPVDDGRLATWKISKRQSHDWQKLAAVPKPAFEAALAGPETPTTAGIIEKHKPPPPEPTPPRKPTKPMDERALWLWGRLRDFERDIPPHPTLPPILKDEPLRLLDEMTPDMREDVLRLAPRVADFLLRMVADEEQRGTCPTDDHGRRLRAAAE